MHLESHFIKTYPFQHFGEYFTFATAQGIVVTVHLFKDSKWFHDNPEITEACSFFIETDRPPMGLDIRLRNTILDILTKFLKETNAIVIYHCDIRDGKGHVRHAKFNRWFSIINDPSIEKQDRQVMIIDLKIDENDNIIRSELPVYASMLLRKSHPDYEAALRLFYSGDVDKSGKL